MISTALRLGCAITLSDAVGGLGQDCWLLNQPLQAPEAPIHGPDFRRT